MRPFSNLGDNIHKYEPFSLYESKRIQYILKKIDWMTKEGVWKTWKAHVKPLTDAEPSLRPCIRPTIIDLVKKFKELAFQNDGCYADT